MFISHASEDKDSVALPLATCLQRAGLRVWLDRQELLLGDSLREKIDQGLAESRFGIVILSPHFFKKGWPKRELNGLFALAEDGRKTILPVWHQVTKADVAENSPILADMLAASTAVGIEPAAKMIVRVVLEAEDAPSSVSPTSVRCLLNLLDRHAPPSEILELLRWHTGLLTRGGAREVGFHLILNSKFGTIVVPFALVSQQYSIGCTNVCLTGVAEADGAMLDGDVPAKDIREATEQLRAALVKADAGAVPDSFRDIAGNNCLTFQALVYARRRERLSDEERKYLRDTYSLWQSLGSYRDALARYRHDVELCRLQGLPPPSPDLMPVAPPFQLGPDEYPEVFLHTYDAMLDHSL